MKVVLVFALLRCGIYASNTESPPKQKVIKQFELWSAAAISGRVQKWASHYPELVHVTTAQDEYGLPRAGGADDCPHDEGDDGCLNYILTIQDFVKHPEGSDSSNRLPEVLWSGELHGNERVGPTAVMEATSLLLDAATCTSLPRMALKSKGDKEWETELQRARKCREEMADVGISEENMKWLARLVSTRRIVVVPTANALGYYQSTREENGVDPNRDFPFDVQDPSKCMQTIAGRTLNEVYREHMFQLSLTFHGGMEVIGYEWGAPTYLNDDSPDDKAQNKIAHAYSRFAGGWQGTKSYDYGSMNSLVYPVRGGFEDWAYAGSWDPDRVIQCEPTSYGGYAATKTKYDDSTLRAFNMLVETSNHKIPKTESLGTDEDLMNSETPGNGHISRNIRLAWLAAELVEPYVAWKSVESQPLSDDVVPLVSNRGDSCKSSRLVSVPVGSQTISFEWNVGGSLNTDSTEVWIAKWDTIDDAEVQCEVQPSIDYLRKNFEKVEVKSTTKGPNRFSGNGSTTFEAVVDLSAFKENENVLIFTSATVDQAWSVQDNASNVAPSNRPESHIVNARTNNDWYHEKDQKIVRGRLHWFSEPLTVSIRPKKTPSNVREESCRIGRCETDMNPGNGENSPTWNPNRKKSSTSFLLPIAVAALIGGVVVVVGRNIFRNKLRTKRRDQIRDYIEDSDAPSPGLEKKGNGGNYSDITDDDEIELGEYS